MRKCILAVLFTVLSGVSSGQTQNNDILNELYKNGKYGEILIKGREEAKTNTDPQIDDLIARSYLAVGKHDSASIFFNRVLQKDKDQTWLSAWAHCYIGIISYYNKDYQQAITELNKTIELDKTRNSTRQAKRTLITAGLTRFFNSWYIVEGQNIRFHFQDTMGINIGKYIARHEKSYTEINKIFQAALPKKLDYFVWETAYNAKQQFNWQLGFSEPTYCLAHVHPDQSSGHEITHTLSYWAWGTPPVSKSRFIDEGISTAFDQNAYDKYEYARKHLENSKIKSVVEIWEHPANYSEEIVYGVGAAFIVYFLEKTTIQHFKYIVKNQQLDDCKKLLGERYNKIIDGFDEMVGLRK